MAESTPLQDRAAKLKEQLRLDSQGAPTKEQFNVVVPPAEHHTAYAKPQLYTEHSCGVCPAWHRSHINVPMGQCLRAQRYLGAVLYRTDLDGCTLPLTDKEKANHR